MSDRDVQVRISFGALTVLINEEGVSHSPDVLDDLCSRTLSLFKDALKDTSIFDDDDAEADTSDTD
jgi:hypothetical protein